MAQIEITIDTPYVTLSQLLKMANVVGSGGEVKHLLQDDPPLVNDMAETRRGRKLYPGDTVTASGQTYVIQAASQSRTE